MRGQTSIAPEPSGVDGYRVVQAGAVTRGIAIAIDAGLVNLTLALLTTLLSIVFRHFFGKLDISGAAAAVATGTAWFVIAGVYLLLFWISVGQTPGMRVMGIRLMAAEGGRLPPRRAVIRVIGLFPATALLGIGLLMVLVDDRRQGLHDKLARSLVVYIPDEAPKGIGPRARQQPDRPLRTGKADVPS